MARDTSRPTDGAGPRYRESQRGLVVLRLVTEVRSDGLSVRLGPLQRSFRHVPFDETESVAVRRYSAADYGGWHWGVRTGPGGDTAYRLRGDEGVELRRTDGSRLFVGSGRAGELRDAIAAAGDVAVAD